MHFIYLVFPKGTKYIPKQKEEEKTKDLVRYFEKFRKKLNNVVYFKETFPGIFELDRKLKLSQTMSHLKNGMRFMNFVSESEIG